MFITKLKVKKIYNNMYELKEPLVYNKITVPSGFLTDFASVPDGLTWLFTKTGKYSRASVVHDYLYACEDYGRKQSDLIFYDAMKFDKVDVFTRSIFYIAVRLFGKGRKA